MTGRIKTLSAGSASGFITAQDGVSVYFHSSAVLEYDIAALSVGQLVTFDLVNGHYPRAANVCVQRHPHVPGAQEKRQEAVQLRYLGFDQTGSTRVYRFQRASPGEQTATFIVTADLALFRNHRVGMQEGPALCMQILAAELAGPASILLPPLQRALTNEHMLTYLASRPASVRKSRPKVAPRTHHASHAG